MGKIFTATNNALHGSGRIVEKSGTLLRIEKEPETTGGDCVLCL